jgi:membrane protein DedA with SNARE-associated domain
VSELLGRLGETIQGIIQAFGYIGIILVMAAENVFPPIPSELVMPFAGFMAREGSFNIWLVILSGMVGSVIGALVLYYFGAWANETVIRRFIRRWGRYAFISENDLDVSLSYFSRYGEVVIFFGRLIPIVRSLISIPAGMARMPMPKFLFFTVLGTTLWSAFLSYMGWFLQANWGAVAGWIEQYQRVVLVVVALAVLAFLYFRVVAPRLRRTSAIEQK